MGRKNACVWYKTKDVMQILNISRSAAQKIVRQLNEELKDAGYIVMPGRVNRFYFEKRIGYDFSKEGGERGQIRA